MTRTIYYTATTLDGFIATDAHSLDWLVTRENDPHGPLGYEAFAAGVGALAMGRSTYDWLLAHQVDAEPGASWPYEQPTWVFTHREIRDVGGDVRATDDDVRRVHAAMVEAAGDRDVWVVGGGDLAGQLADVGLLDEVIVSIAPVTLGSGAPLLPRHVELRRTESAVNGEFVCARFDVVR